MPSHQQIPQAHVSSCQLCGAQGDDLTTDCPGVLLAPHIRQEVCETNLDYTDARGWHQGTAKDQRIPNFGQPQPDLPRSDPRASIAPSIDWAAIDRSAELQHALAKRAIAWVVADRACEEASAELTRVEDEMRRAEAEIHQHATSALARDRFLSADRRALDEARVRFHLADQRAQERDDEFRQAARRLVAALEDRQSPGCV